MIKQHLRKFIICTIRKFITFFISKKELSLSDDLIILGRGKSLNTYFENYDKLKKINNLLIVNFTKEDIGNNINSLKNKNIIPIINIEEPIIPILNIIKLNISLCFIARTEDQKKDTEKRRNFKGLIYGKVNYFTGKIVKDFYDKKISGSGLLAAIYFVNILRVKNVYIFGFDFYQRGMHNISMIDNFKTEENIKVHVEDGKKSIRNFENFIENSPETNFFLPKDTNISVKSTNFHLLDF